MVDYKQSMKKGTVIMFMNPEISGFNASFKLASALKNIGYKVVYIGPADMASEVYCAKQGFYYKGFKSPFSFKRRVRRLGIWRKDRQRLLWIHQFNKDVEEWLKVNPPDLVILHFLLFDFSIPFLKLKIPLVSFCTNFSCGFSTLYPPTFSKIIPGAKIGLLQRGKNFIVWSLLYLLFTSVNIFNNLDCLFLYGLSFRSKKTKNLVKKFGGKLKFFEYGYRLQGPELVANPAEIDFPGATQFGLRMYMGANIAVKRKDVTFQWAGVDPKKPLLYCSLGSYSYSCKNRLNVFNALIEAMSQRPSLQAILQVNEDLLNQGKLKPIPANVMVSKWVPQLKILSKATLFITHGGMGSIRESIWFGVPMIVLPFGVDQPGSAARVVYHHLGVMANKKKITPRTIGGLIDKILNDTGYFESARRMQQIFRRSKENFSKGLEFVEDLIKESKLKNNNKK